MTDRARMFRKRQTVSITRPIVTDLGDAVRVEFEQTWSSATYADRCTKHLVMRAGANGELLIVSEELLHSEVL
jgi:hypothetical protein